MAGAGMEAAGTIWVFGAVVLTISLLHGVVTQGTDPNVPTNVTVTPTSESTLEVAWDPPLEGQPEYYVVLWTGVGFADNFIVYDTQYTIKGLMACERYSVAVKAYIKNEGYTPESEPQSATTMDEVPPAPVSCSVKRIETTQVYLTWESPSTSCLVVNYTVSWSWQAMWGDNVVGTGSAEHKDHQHTISGVAPYSNVTMDIAATTSAGYGSTINCLAETKEAFPSAPLLTNATEGAGYIEVTWSPPKQANGVIREYRVSWGETINDSATLSGQVTSGHVEGLTSCRSYNLTVAARTSAGFGPKSNAIGIDVTGQAPIDTVKCLAGTHDFTVVWDHTPIDCTDDVYSVAWTSVVLWSHMEGSGEGNASGNANSFTLKDPSPYTRYNVCVAISNIENSAACCTNTTNEEAPSAPTQVATLSRFGNGVVTWAFPDAPNGQVRNYSVLWAGPSGATGTEEFPDVLEGHLEGLDVCKTYNVKVKAKTVEWGPESDSQELKIENYVEEVTCQLKTTNTEVAMTYRFADQQCQVDSATCDVSMTVLWNNQTYSKSMTYTNNPLSGSDMIRDIEAYTKVRVCVSATARPEEAFCCTVITEEEVPDQPSAPGVGEVGNTTALITWSLPAHVNGQLKGWEVSWSSSSGSLGKENLTEDKRSYLITELDPSTQYTAVVKAKTGAGLGEAVTIPFRTVGPPTDTPSNMGLIVGGAVGGVVLLLGLVGVFCYKRRGKGKGIGEGREEGPQDMKTMSRIDHQPDGGEDNHSYEEESAL